MTSATRPRSAREWPAATRSSTPLRCTRSGSPPRSIQRCTRRTSPGPSASCAPRWRPKVAKVVYVSTVGVFGNTHRKVVDESYEHPGKEFTSYYEETKLEAHRIAKRMIADEGLPCTIVQPGGVYGPGDTSQVADLLEQFVAGKLPLMPFPELGICLTHVEDIANGILLALDKGKVGETYVISGPVTTMREAMEVVARPDRSQGPQARSADPSNEGDDADRAVGWQDDEPAPQSARADLLADGVTFWASHEKASRELGYAPRGMEEGLRQTLAEDKRFPDPVA